MTAHRDPDRLIHAFLKEGQTELADPVYDAVRAGIETTRQRAVIGPWRTPDVTRYLKFGLTVAAVVIIAFVGYRLFGGSNVGGPGATETPQPTAKPTASPTPTPAPAGLPVGSSHLLWNGPPLITVTIPAPGWFGEAGSGFITKNDADPPAGAGMIAFTGPLYVYGDPCHWEATKPATPSTTVDELAAALAKQSARDASTPVDITLGNYTGKSITLHVPDVAPYASGQFSGCDQGYFGSWAVGSDPTPSRYHQGPGQIDELSILNVNGALVVIDTGHYAGTPAKDLAELRAIVEAAGISW